MSNAWPTLPLSAWQDTRDTVHMWTQIVGKVRMALAPLTNHWWNVTLYVSVRGLTTSLMPYGDRGLEMEFDFCNHSLDIRNTDGGERSVRLEPRSVADFYAETMSRLKELDMPVRIWPQPVEVAESIRFDEDEKHASYDAEYAHRFWLSMVQTQRVLSEFRSKFVGKVSPVHFFWGGFDMACTRFSGREAPRHPGGVPNCPDWVQYEAYSHEVASCGYWPGAGGEEGAFYAYAYPEPDGFKDQSPGVDGAVYDPTWGEFMLPYEIVRKSENPDATLMSFLQATYVAAADLAGWDREHLEAPRPADRQTASPSSG